MVLGPNPDGLAAERLSRLLIACYPFERFTDSSHRQQDGNPPSNSPASTSRGIHWLQFIPQHWRAEKRNVTLGKVRSDASETDEAT